MLLRMITKSIDINDSGLLICLVKKKILIK